MECTFCDTMLPSMPTKQIEPLALDGGDIPGGSFVE